MCGIAAFSTPEGSSVNARLLAHHLLTEIESRGSHASGFAYINADGNVGIYKNPTPGSQLSLHELPRNARTVVLHTRYATQGHQSDNRNNHPVISTDRRIALVHNGVISNDLRLRPELGIEDKHGQVDSLVIPSLIAQQGMDGLTQLAGYAAIAWLDTTAPKQLFIARLKNSPVAYTHLSDGTFVMASTPAILELAILNTGYTYGGVFELADSKFITVEGGFIQSHEAAPRMSYDYQSWNRHSAATAGGHASRATGKPAGANTTLSGATSVSTPSGTVHYPKRGSEDAPPAVVMPMADDETVDVDGYLADLEEWRNRQAKKDVNDAAISKRAMAMLSGPKEGWDDETWEEYMSQLEQRESREQENMSCSMGDAVSEGDAVDQYGEGYYILDSEGDISHYADLDLLEKQLAWYAEMSRSEMDLFQVEDNLNWVNHIMDVGHIEGKAKLISWVDDSAEIDDHESPAVRNLQYIREGVQRLESLKGA